MNNNLVYLGLLCFALEGKAAQCAAKLRCATQSTVLYIVLSCYAGQSIASPHVTLPRREALLYYLKWNVIS